MKHMLVNTHNAESCGFRSEEDGNAIGAAIEGLMKSGLTVDHFWINRAAHAFFIVVDAQSAHEIDEADALDRRRYSESPPVLRRGLTNSAQSES